MNSDKYIYKVETHLHTSQGSACGQSTGAQMAAAYKEAGYCAIMVTDHFFNGNCRIRGNYPWDEKISLFVQGYLDAKSEGDKIGLDVYFGFEYNYRGTEFLIYGFDEDNLRAYPGIVSDDMQTALSKIKEAGGYIVHAHPFRKEPYIPFPGRVIPEYTDAVEIFNKGNKLPEFNMLAKEYADQYNKPYFAGSDNHSAASLPDGGMAFPEKPRSLADILNMANKKDCILLGGTVPKSE